MSTAFAEFPVRPRMRTGESVAGYITRLHAENGHRVPYSLRLALGSLYRGTRRDAEAARCELGPILGGANSLVWDWRFDRPIAGAGGGEPPLPVLNFDPVRICPLCIQRDGIHLEVWELPLMEVCPLHRCGLLTHCLACARAFRWSRIVPHWKCLCGCGIGTMPAQTAASISVVFAILFANAKEMPAPDSLRIFKDNGASSSSYSLSSIYAAVYPTCERLRYLSIRSGRIVEELSLSTRFRNSAVEREAWETVLSSIIPATLFQPLCSLLDAALDGHRCHDNC